ncbi:MAG TPA: DUF6351 family protein, partial [Solirubrobacteraceae bacterium]|nr:DUF6351 family protein [Solirubrobacteraceae bacterium]
MRFRSVGGVVAAVAALSGAVPAVAGAVEIEVLSSRADLVSGGDALVRVTGVDDPAGLKVTLGERDVSDQFAKRANGRVEGLLTGIPDGASTLTATSGNEGAKLTLQGHPNGGPMISGPQMQPWICQATAQDAQCNEPAKYELLAKTGPGALKAYDPNNPPSNVKTTTTTEGDEVPFIVRVETGYQNRDQYKIATLYDPSEPWEPWAPQTGWNGRLVFTHGGSCGTDRAAGGAPDVLNEELLGKGFMVASTALNNLGHNCNPVLIAESELMARERVIEQHGPVRATLGTGCSGGSIAQLMVAHAYPGFYDGITVSCTFADLFTTGKHAVAGHLFKNFFKVLSAQGGQVYTPVDEALVNGSPLAVADDFLFDLAFWPAIDGTGGCGGLPDSYARWSTANPQGVRCGVLDHNVNVLGKGRTGYVGVPFDNVGIQFGLKALQQGLMTPAKFVDLNARIGGLDPVTLQPTPQRTEADPSALAASYRAGYMAIGNTLDQTPILEGRGSNELTAHVTYPTKVLRARLDEQFGNHDNHVVWQGPFPVYGSLSFANRMVLEMDKWVGKIQADGRDVPHAQKIREDKPEGLRDQCEAVDGVAVPGDDCPALVRFYNSPSQQAGESLSNDILKCRLKPLRREDYEVRFTDAQWATLQQTFPQGVCDWTKPGVEEQPTVPWLTFAGGPGGQELGAAPRSVPFTLGEPGQPGGPGAPGGEQPGGNG